MSKLMKQWQLLKNEKLHSLIKQYYDIRRINELKSPHGEKMSSKLIRKSIKADKGKLGSQIVINIKEDDIYIAINQNDSDVLELSLTYNQLCSLSRALNVAIDNHYQEYSSDITQEKTQTIYIDDPVDW